MKSVSLSCDYGTSKAVLPLEALGERLYLASRSFCQQPSSSLLVDTSLLSLFLWSHFLLLICVSNSPVLSSHTDTCGCTECQPHNWDNLPISWCLITSAGSFLPYDIHRFQGLGCGYLWKSFFSLLKPQI